MLPFQRFFNNEQAQPVTDRLDEAGVPYTLVTEKPLMDAIYIGATYEPTVVLKLHAGDFSRGHAALEAHYTTLLNEVEPDYYLFSFTNAELVAILAKPDEWNTFDYLLAKKILLEKNAGVDIAAIERLKEHRNRELSRQEDTPFGRLFVGYFLVTGGLISVWFLLNNIFNPGIFSLVIAAFVGSNVYRSINVLPDGNSVPVYSERARYHGKIIYYASLVLLAIGSIGFILWLRNEYRY